MTNDVGNKVIVPQPREAFADTMKRAAAYGQTVTPDQLSAEEQTMPRKAGQALLSFLLIGAGGAAGLAGVGEAGAAAGAAGARAVSAIKAMAEAHSYAAKLVSKALEGAAATAGGTATYKWMKDLLPD